MSRRETVWRVTLGALAVFTFVMGAVNVFDHWTALGYALCSALFAFLALDDAVIDL